MKPLPSSNTNSSLNSSPPAKPNSPHRSIYQYTGPERPAKKFAARLAAREDIRQRVNWTLDQRLTFLRDCTVTPSSEISADSPLCLGPWPGTQVHRQMPRTELYSRLAGDLQDKPEPVASTPLGEIMDRIRSRK